MYRQINVAGALYDVNIHTHKKDAYMGCQLGNLQRDSQEYTVLHFQINHDKSHSRFGITDDMECVKFYETWGRGGH